MASYKKQPGESFDCHVGYGSDGSTANQSLAVRAFVTDPNGSAVSGSPFTLAHEARGEYALRRAFTVNIFGIYRVNYIAYNTYPSDEALNFGRVMDLVDCQYEAIGGLGGGESAGVADYIKNLLDEIPKKVWRFNPSEIKNRETLYQILLGALGGGDNQKIQVALAQIMTAVESIQVPNYSSEIANVLGSVRTLSLEFTKAFQTLEQKLSSLDRNGEISKTLESIIGFLTQIEKKEMKVEVDVQKFLDGVESISERAKDGIVGVLEDRIVKAGDKADVVDLLKKLFSREPDLSSITELIKELDRVQTAKLKEVARLILGDVRKIKNINIHLSKDDEKFL